MSFGLGGMGGVSSFPEPESTVLGRGAGDGIKGSTVFKVVDAIVKTVATYYTMGSTGSMAVNAWKRALTTPDTSQGKLYVAGQSGGVGGGDPYGPAKEMFGYLSGKGQGYLTEKIKELAKIEQTSKAGGAGGPAEAILKRAESGMPPGANPYTGTMNADMARWGGQNIGVGDAITGYDSTNPWASILGDSMGSGFGTDFGGTDFGGGGFGTDAVNWNYDGAGDWFGGGSGYGLDNMGLSDFGGGTDWGDSMSGFSDLFSS